MNYLHNRAIQYMPHDVNVTSLQVTIIPPEPKQQTTKNSSTNQNNEVFKEHNKAWGVLYN